MRDRLPDFGSGVEVVLITFTNQENLVAYEAAQALPFPVVIDRDRDAYQAYGVGRGSVRRVWGWRAARKYLEILRSHRGRVRRPTEDTLQLGGDFVIAPDGTLAMGYWGAGPDDRPSVDTLLSAVRKTS